jgi:hypothetical protein
LHHRNPRLNKVCVGIVGDLQVTVRS